MCSLSSPSYQHDVLLMAGGLRERILGKSKDICLMCSSETSMITSASMSCLLSTWVSQESSFKE